MQFIPVKKYAKLRKISEQAVYGLIHRGSVPLRKKVKMTWLIGVDEEDPPHKYKREQGKKIV